VELLAALLGSVSRAGCLRFFYYVAHVYFTSCIVISILPQAKERHVQ
jgi:hypothetical protein